MKKILLFTIISAFIFTACGKKEDSAGIKPGLSCDIDGKSWVGDTTANITKGGDFYSISASQGNIFGPQFEFLNISLKGELKPGDYSLTTENDQSYAIFNSTITKKDKKSENDFDAFHSTDGKVSITKVDDSHAEGTFNYTLVTVDEPKKTLKVTNGKFNLKIVK